MQIRSKENLTMTQNKKDPTTLTLELSNIQTTDLDENTLESPKIMQMFGVQNLSPAIAPEVFPTKIEGKLFGRHHHPIANIITSRAGSSGNPDFNHINVIWLWDINCPFSMIAKKTFLKLFSDKPQEWLDKVIPGPVGIKINGRKHLVEIQNEADPKIKNSSFCGLNVLGADFGWNNNILETIDMSVVKKCFSIELRDPQV